MQDKWWTKTGNPVRGCNKVSPGCLNCYAERFAERWRGVAGNAYEQGFDLRLVPEKLLEPFSWAKPQIIFVNSMSDLFHEGVPFEYILLMFDIMRSAYWHRFLILTKRSDRMVDFWDSNRVSNWCPHNIYMGVSVENKRHGIPRIAKLQRIRAGMRFLSVEPLLGNLGDIPLDGIGWVTERLRHE